MRVSSVAVVCRELTNRTGSGDKRSQMKVGMVSASAHGSLMLRLFHSAAMWALGESRPASSNSVVIDYATAFGSPALSFSGAPPSYPASK